MDRCAHKLCFCEVGEAQYCSPRCETMANRDIAADGCECEHPACQKGHHTGIPPMQ